MRAMKARSLAPALAALALSAAAADVDFTDAALFKDDALPSLSAESLNSWTALAGKLKFTFQGGGKDRAVWLGGNRDRARLDVRAFDFPVYEVQAAFKPDGSALAQMEFVLFSRGDVMMSGGGKTPLAPRISAAVRDDKAFRGLFEELKGKIVAAFGQPVDPKPRNTSRVDNHDQRQYRWKAPAGFVLLSVGLTKEKNAFRGEYIRVAVRPAGADDAAKNLAAMTGPRPVSGAAEAKVTANRADLTANVKREPGGLVWVDGIPMVDQGDKGYCAVATLERLIRYYGGTTSQHELAQLFDSDAKGGTSFRVDPKTGRPIEFVAPEICRQFGFSQKVVDFDKPKPEKLLKDYNKRAAVKLEADKKMRDDDIDRLLKKADPATLLAVVADEGSCKRFIPKVKQFIDKGVPLVWMIPGHIRMLIGYNETTGEIVYSDSWGKGHEKKTMSLAEAFMMTQALIVVRP